VLSRHGQPVVPIFRERPAPTSAEKLALSKHHRQRARESGPEEMPLAVRTGST